MLTQERYSYVLQVLEERKAVSVSDLTKELNISESTIRRDLNALAKMGKINKVHGGATYLEPKNSVTHEDIVEVRKGIHTLQKEAIGKYAASLIEPEDFVYLDGGTTTASMIPYLTEKKAIYVTNALEIAMQLVKKEFTIYIVAGRIRHVTETAVGCEAEKSIENFHFTKGFFGANGISLEAGYSTPNIEEARMKKLAMKRSYRVYVLADTSKFSVNSSVTFGNLEDAAIITNQLTDKIYKESTTVIEV
ncbi:MAG: DeoR/GlpR family DNA-binding transcription regulator [Lachnospiraceae bacterium]|nr:DeoR/GlpR family DNA-binding transcription regulator [Lachnospiraceae bacterium]